MSFQPRQKFNNEQIALLDSLKSVIDQLDESNVFAFAGRYLVSKEEKDKIRLFTLEKDVAKLGTLPLDAEAARAIYEAADDGEQGQGRILRPEHFALTGSFPLPQWIISRLSNNYSDPLEIELEGLIALQTGDELPLSAHPDYSESWYGDWSTLVGYLYLCLPTSFSGGHVTVTKPQQDEDATPFTNVLDWSKGVTSDFLYPVTSKPNPELQASGKGWQIPWVYYEAPAKISIAPVEEGTMLVLRYKLRAADEDDARGGWLPSLDPSREVGNIIIKERLIKILNEESILPQGGKLALGLSGSYDIPEKEDKAQKDDGSDNEQSRSEEDGEVSEPKEQEEGVGDEEAKVENDEEDYVFPGPYQYTQEEEDAFLASLVSKLTGVDKCLVDILQELGFQWEFRGVWYPYDEGEGEDEKPKDDEDGKVDEENGVEEDDKDNGAEDDVKANEGADEKTEPEGLEDETREDEDVAKEDEVEEEIEVDDPTTTDDTWISPKGINLSLIQGKYIPDSLRKALRDAGVKQNDPEVYWLNRPSQNPISCWYKIREKSTSLWECWSTVTVGIALFVDLPPAAERKRSVDGQ